MAVTFSMRVGTAAAPSLTLVGQLATQGAALSAIQLTAVQ